MFNLFGKRQAHDNKRDAAFEFDFAKVPDVDDNTVRAFFNTTHTQSRKMPLLIARHVFEQLEDQLSGQKPLDAMELAEIRGGMKALRLFGYYYTNGIKEWEKKKEEERNRE